MSTIQRQKEAILKCDSCFNEIVWKLSSSNYRPRPMRRYKMRKIARKSYDWNFYRGYDYCKYCSKHKLPWFFVKWWRRVSTYLTEERLAWPG